MTEVRKAFAGIVLGVGLFWTGCFLHAGGPKLLGGLAWGKYAAPWEMSNVSKPGHLIGIGYEWGSGRLAYEVEAIYFLKTSSYPSRGWEYEMGEISVPFAAKYEFLPRSTPFVLAGGEIAYILSHKQKPGPSGGNSVYDMRDNTRRIDFGLVAGAGFALETGTLTIELSGRYHHGLAKVSGLTYREYDLKTREWAVVFGLLFD